MVVIIMKLTAAAIFFLLMGIQMSVRIPKVRWPKLGPKKGTTFRRRNPLRLQSDWEQSFQNAKSGIGSSAAATEGGHRYSSRLGEAFESGVESAKTYVIRNNEYIRSSSICKNNNKMLFV